MSRGKQEKQAGKCPTSHSRPRWLWLVLAGVGVLIVAAVIAALLWPRSLGIEAQALPAHGDKSLLASVQSFPNEGQTHIKNDAPTDYRTSPPTSGSHYDNPTTAGFYDEPQPYGNLVHNLEHGAVVIYYDPKELSDDARRSLKAFASAHRDPWASVIVVPNPEKAVDATYALTAWTKMLKLNTYDARVVQAFLAEYLGRGPEHPVR
jgi:hypothetical protein